jgi:hypothetical protein
MIHEGHEEHQGSEAGFGMTRLIPKDDVCAVVGATIDVHRELGPGFPEAVRREALETALREQGISFEAQERFVL